MPFDGNGTYNPVNAPVFPAVAGQTILSSQYNSQINDMAAALSLAITRDGQGKPTANIDWNNKKLVNLAAPTAGGDAVNKTYADTKGPGLDMVSGFSGDNLVNGSVLTMNVNYVVFRDANYLQLVKTGIAAKACDFSVAGPAVQGRDQAGSFAANSSLNYFYIYNPTTDTVDSICSTSAIPALPSGYTMWAYAGSVAMNGALALQKVSARGGYFYMYGGNGNNVMTGINSTPTLQALTGYVPNQAVSVLYHMGISGTVNAATGLTLSAYPDGGGTTAINVLDKWVPAAGNIRDSGCIELPVYASAPGIRAFFSQGFGAITSGGGWIDVIGYRCRNGDA